MLDGPDGDDAPDGLGGDQDSGAGDTAETDGDIDGGGQQLASLPPMIGQDGLPLIVPIIRNRDQGKVSQ